MDFLEMLKIAVSHLARNKMRSGLTALGVVIGVAAVISLVSVGEGASYAVTSQVQKLGSNLITVSTMRHLGGKLELGDAQMLLERVPSIVNSVPSVTASASAKWLNRTYETTVEGSTPGYAAVLNVSVAQGRFLLPEDVSERRKVAVVGQTVVEELFQGSPPIGQSIMLNGQQFTVVGVLAPKGGGIGRDYDDTILIPVTTAMRLIGTTTLNAIYCQARSADDAKAAVDHILVIFEKKLRRPDLVRVFSQDELIQTVGSVTGTMTTMLGAIGGISLLVGGIGIMNIMLVSVAERTKEIGIRKAVGAKRRDILLQFLVESVVVSLVGGVTGVALGAGGSAAISRFSGFATRISPAAVLLGFCFSLAVGLFFGVYPAMRAASLDPVEALRRE